jgi:serine/threonine-protein kinase
MDRIEAMRGYALLTLGAAGLGIAGFIAGVSEVPPLVLAPLVPIYMSVKLWRRGKSLRQSGLRLRRVLLMPRARHAFPTQPRTAQQHRLEKVAPREVLDSPYGTAVRRAVEDRAAILEIAARLPKEERAQLKELEPTIKALVERVSQLAQTVHRLDQSIDPNLTEEIESRIAVAERERRSPEGDRQLALLRRQRLTLDELVQRRVTLARQLDNAALTLGNLRLDLIKLRSSGLQSALSDVSMATQEARALSREISAVLEASAELEKL